MILYRFLHAFLHASLYRFLHASPVQVSTCFSVQVSTRDSIRVSMHRMGSMKLFLCVRMRVYLELLAVNMQKVVRLSSGWKV